MKLQKTLSFLTINNDEKGIDHTRHLTGTERVSLLEDLRREMSRITGNEYPSRLRRVLEIAQRGNRQIPSEPQ